MPETVTIDGEEWVVLRQGTPGRTHGTKARVDDMGWLTIGDIDGCVVLSPTETQALREMLSPKADAPCCYCHRTSCDCADDG